MGKEDIFSKFNIVNYNNELEKVLEKKDFSVDTQNLLLSMLYKIETGYKDYAEIKQLSRDENKFVENIINIIKKDCDKINLLNLKSEKVKKFKEANIRYVIDRKNKRIVCMPNEQDLLSSILEISRTNDKFIRKNNDILKDAIKDFFIKSNIMDKLEIIRDFNGWSWNINEKEISDISYNLLFKNLQILLGNEYIDELIYSNEKLDIIEKIKSKLYRLYGKQKAEEFVNSMNLVIVNRYIQDKEEHKKYILSRIKELENQIIEMENKSKYLDKMSNIKKNALRKIDKLDKILSDDKLIKKEFKIRNEKLKDKEKIFSISNLVEILNNERKININKIENINFIMIPRNFVSKKSELLNELIFLKNIRIEKEESLDNILKSQKNFLNLLEKKIIKAEKKDAIINLIYIFRYYNSLLITKKTPIYECGLLQENLDVVGKTLVKKAYERDVINIYTTKGKINYKIFKNIFRTKIIEMKNIISLLKEKKDSIDLELYNEDILEEKYNVEIEDTENSKLKLNKKIKLFI